MMGRDLSMKKGIFSVCAPPPPPPPHPQYVMQPQLQSTCHYIVIHYVKLWQVRLGGGGGGGGGAANNIHTLSGGSQMKNIKFCI